MTQTLHQITRGDIMPMDAYAKIRKERRAEIVERKQHRRVALGPDMTFYFESYETMWLQIHEMLYIERGGEEQLADELAAFNPLIPQGHELVATMMIEIDDEDRRKRVLDGLGGVEDKIYIQLDGQKIMARPENDVERTTAAGKTSSVHFLHFPFTRQQITLFRNDTTPVFLAVEHDNYHHMAGISGATREALAQDFDVS
jgi:hypothetical protein